MGCGASMPEQAAAAAPQSAPAKAPSQPQAPPAAATSAPDPTPPADASAGAAAAPQSAPAKAPSQPQAPPAAATSAPDPTPPADASVTVPAAAAAAQDGFATTGVSLSFLLSFISDLAPEWTTQEVVTHYVQPRTEACRYVHLIPQHTGVPTHFISHRWGSRFRDTVGLVLRFFGIQLGDADAQQRAKELDQQGVRVWLDILAVNQHPGVEQTDDLARLCDMVRTSQRTLLCLDPEGEVLRRVWCLYEIWQTVEAEQGAVDGEGGGGKLMVLCDEVDSTAMSNIFETLNALQARATVEADRIKILDGIKSSIGVESLNAKIKEALVHSTMSELRRVEARQAAAAAAAAAGGTAGDAANKRELAVVLAKCAGMLFAFGRYTEARKVILEELPALQAAIPDDPAIADVLVVLARAHRKLASPDDKPRLREAMALYAKAEGHSEKYLYAQLHLGVAFNANSQAAEAMQETREAYEGLAARWGASNPRMVEVYLEAAEVYRMSGGTGAKDEARKLLLHAMDTAKAAFGEEHYRTALVLMAYGEHLRGAGKDKEALDMLLSAQRIVATNLGPAHLLIGHCATRIASVYINMQEWEEVAQQSLRTVDVYLQWFEPDHVFIAHARAKVARARVAQKRYQEALDAATPAWAVLSRYSNDAFHPFCKWCLDTARDNL